MTCDMREQELLLLAHGELPLPRRLATRAHLSRCASCRARYAGMGRVSSVLAGAVRGPEAAPWSPALNRAGNRAGASVPLRLFLARAALLALLLLAVALTLRVVSQWRSASSEQARPRVQAIRTPGCAPDLPNDKCR